MFYRERKKEHKLAMLEKEEASLLKKNNADTVVRI
jgi:hypothetical protein